MNYNPTLNRRQFLRTAGQAATTLAAASTFAPAMLPAQSPGKAIGVGCIGLGTRGGDLIDAVVRAPHNQTPGLPEGYERGKTPVQPDHMLDWVNCIRIRGTPKCSTDEAFIETATFLMSLVSQQERRLVRWDASREEIV